MDHKQLNVRLPVSLVDALKAEAASSGMTLNALVIRRLSGEVAIARPETPELAGDLAARLAAVETRLAALEARPRRQPRTEKPAVALSPAPQASATDPEPQAESIESLPLIAALAGQLTTAELAERLGMKRGSFNERLRRAGGARVGLVMDGWRCVGQGPGPNGGPLRWLWEQA